VPIQKTLLLINNFVLNTTSFLNNFTEVCEKKLSGVSGKLSELEILLAVLEAKLDSIPGIDDGVAPSSAASVPAESTASSSAPAAADPAATTPAAAAPAPAVVEPVAAAAADNGMVAVKDHPDYKPFAKLLKVGVPLQAAKNKLSAAGLNLDPEMLNDPDQMIPMNRATSTMLVAAGSSEDNEPEDNSMALTVVD
jgi:WASH complex subunit CCDC53